MQMGTDIHLSGLLGGMNEMRGLAYNRYSINETPSAEDVRASPLKKGQRGALPLGSLVSKGPLQIDLFPRFRTLRQHLLGQVKKTPASASCMPQPDTAALY